MANVVVVGQRAANQAFNPAIQQAQAQVPAINNLYATLLSGLQNQGQSQLQNVLTSAEQRGVMRASQPASTQEALASTLMQSGAQLGAQRAQNVAGIGGVVGQGQAQRALSAQQLVEGLTAADIAARENKLKLTEISRADEINTIKNQVAEAKAAARAAASSSRQAAEFDLTSVSEGTLGRQLKVFLNGKRGSDGHVSPENLAKAYNTWQAAGLDNESFWKRYQGLWNPKQGTYNDEFQYFVKKGI